MGYTLHDFVGLLKGFVFGGILEFALTYFPPGQSGTPSPLSLLLPSSLCAASDWRDRQVTSLIVQLCKHSTGQGQRRAVKVLHIMGARFPWIFRETGLAGETAGGMVAAQEEYLDSFSGGMHC